MNEPAERLEQAIRGGEARLRGFTDAAAGAAHGGGWSKKQELGHLIDSATNNRVRFIGAALAGQWIGPSYDGPGWVRLGGYAEADWNELIELWAELNRALAGVVRRIPRERLAAECRVGESFRGTLEALIQDYLRHLQHHLDHITGPAVA